MDTVLEIRKTISAPLIKKEISDYCYETGITATALAYDLLIDFVHKRVSARTLSHNITNDKLSTKTLIAEIVRVVDRYEKNFSVQIDSSSPERRRG